MLREPSMLETLTILAPPALRRRGSSVLVTVTAPEDVGLIGAAHLVGGHLGHRRPVLGHSGDYGQ